MKYEYSYFLIYTKIFSFQNFSCKESLMFRPLTGKLKQGSAFLKRSISIRITQYANSTTLNTLIPVKRPIVPPKKKTRDGQMSHCNARSEAQVPRVDSIPAKVVRLSFSILVAVASS